MRISTKKHGKESISVFFFCKVEGYFENRWCQIQHLFFLHSYHTFVLSSPILAQLKCAKVFIGPYKEIKVKYQIQSVLVVFSVRIRILWRLFQFFASTLFLSILISLASDAFFATFVCLTVSVLLKLNSTPKTLSSDDFSSVNLFFFSQTLNSDKFDPDACVLFTLAWTLDSVGAISDSLESSVATFLPNSIVSTCFLLVVTWFNISACLSLTVYLFEKKRNYSQLFFKYGA